MFYVSSSCRRAVRHRAIVEASCCRHRAVVVPLCRDSIVPLCSRAVVMLSSKQSEQNCPPKQLAPPRKTQYQTTELVSCCGRRRRVQSVRRAVRPSTQSACPELADRMSKGMYGIG